ncbi:MAG: hypothetical protein KC561_02125 [Myxococcales bacterium]|nr:hypothetical protein [Myxococcales bacterium]
MATAPEGYETGAALLYYVDPETSSIELRQVLTEDSLGFGIAASADGGVLVIASQVGLFFYELSDGRWERIDRVGFEDLTDIEVRDGWAIASGALRSQIFDVH